MIAKKPHSISPLLSMLSTSFAGSTIAVRILSLQCIYMFFLRRCQCWSMRSCLHLHQSLSQNWSTRTSTTSKAHYMATLISVCPTSMLLTLRTHRDLTTQLQMLTTPCLFAGEILIIELHSLTMADLFSLCC